VRKPHWHALRVVALGVALGVVLYAGYLAIGMLP
jgi:hypothetical protein